MKKYLPETAFTGNESEEEMKDIFKTIYQMVKPDLSETSLKYPLNFSEFEKFISQQDHKPIKNLK